MPIQTFKNEKLQTLIPKRIFFILVMAHHSSQCEFSCRRYVVCGTNWCMAGNRVCIVDGKGCVVKRYNDYPITNCCNCNATKMTASQASYIPAGNRSNNNSILDCDPRDGYRSASYQLKVVNSENSGFHQSLTCNQESRNNCRELDGFDDDRNEDCLSGCLFCVGTTHSIVFCHSESRKFCNFKDFFSFYVENYVEAFHLIAIIYLKAVISSDYYDIL